METIQEVNRNASRPIADIKLSTRVRKCLNRLGLKTLEEVALRSEGELLTTRNFSSISLKELNQVLADRGLSLRPPQQPIEQRQKEMIPISDLNLIPNAKIALNSINVKTLGDLLEYSEEQLLKVKYFGLSSLTEIKKQLATLGLSLRDRPPTQPRTTKVTIHLTQNKYTWTATFLEICSIHSSQKFRDRERTIKHAERVMKSFNLQMEIIDRLQDHILTFEFSISTRQRLMAAKIVNFGDLLEYSEEQLLATKLFTKTAITEIKQELAYYGFTLRPDAPKEKTYSKPILALVPTCPS